MQQIKMQFKKDTMKKIRHNRKELFRQTLTVMIKQIPDHNRLTSKTFLSINPIAALEKPVNESANMLGFL